MGYQPLPRSRAPLAVLPPRRSWWRTLLWCWALRRRGFWRDRHWRCGSCGRARPQTREECPCALQGPYRSRMQLARAALPPWPPPPLPRHLDARPVPAEVSELVRRQFDDAAKTARQSIQTIRRLPDPLPPTRRSE